MNPIDIRNINWDALQEHLRGDLLRVWEAWTKWGPGTTRQISGYSGIDILTFRPRTTDLVHIGAVALVSTAPCREGRYRARTYSEWKTWFAQQQKPTPSQLLLSIGEVGRVPEITQ